MRTLILTSLVALSWLAGCSDFTYGRDLEGVVVDSGTRFKSKKGGAEEKVSLIVKSANPDSKIAEVACGPSGCAIECLSTRCASIAVGTCHRFECKYKHRMWEPDVIACKHDKEVACATPPKK